MGEKEKKPILSIKNPWDKNENPIWLGSTISLSRNIEKYNFPSKLASDKRKQIISLASKELLNSDQLDHPKLYKGEDISHNEKEFLVEHFLSMHSFHQAHSGEAFILDNSGELLISLNLQDHINFQLTDCKGELENGWNRLVKLEMAFGKSVNYSFSRKFGFLTSDFTQCGTGLLVNVFLQLPALIHTEKLMDFLEKHNEEAIGITALQGNPHELIGDLAVIYNNYTLGLTEENIISTLRTFVTKLVVDEKSERSKIRNEDNAEIKDKISRAYGILIHSYQIEAIEALNALSLMKLGVDLGWVSGLSMAQLNELTFKCRRAHLLTEFETTPTQEEVSHKRAEFLHKSLKSLSLNT